MVRIIGIRNTGELHKEVKLISVTPLPYMNWKPLQVFFFNN